MPPSFIFCLAPEVLRHCCAVWPGFPAATYFLSLPNVYIIQEEKEAVHIQLVTTALHSCPAGSLKHGWLLCFERHAVCLPLTHVWPLASLGYAEHNYLVNGQIYAGLNSEYTPVSALNFYNFPHSLITFGVLANFLVTVCDAQII